jgi:hypothetical protein
MTRSLNLRISTTVTTFSNRKSRPSFIATTSVCSNINFGLTVLSCANGGSRRDQAFSVCTHLLLRAVQFKLTKDRQITPSSGKLRFTASLSRSWKSASGRSLQILLLPPHSEKNGPRFALSSDLYLLWVNSLARFLETPSGTRHKPNSLSCQRNLKGISKPTDFMHRVSPNFTNTHGRAVSKDRVF